MKRLGSESGTGSVSQWRRSADRDRGKMSRISNTMYRYLLYCDYAVYTIKYPPVRKWLVCRNQCWRFGSAGSAYLFGPSGSGTVSIIQRYRSWSGFFPFLIIKLLTQNFEKNKFLRLKTMCLRVSFKKKIWKIIFLHP